MDVSIYLHTNQGFRTEVVPRMSTYSKWVREADCHLWPGTSWCIVNLVVWIGFKWLRFCWLKVICCICQSNELEREIKQKTGGESRGPAKTLGGPWTTQVSP